MVEAHDWDRTGGVPDLHRHTCVACQQGNWSAGTIVQPIDLALQQCRVCCGSISHRQPFHAIEMCHLRAGGVARGPAVAWRIVRQIAHTRCVLPR